MNFFFLTLFTCLLISTGVRLSHDNPTSDNTTCFQTLNVQSCRFFLNSSHSTAVFLNGAAVQYRRVVKVSYRRRYISGLVRLLLLLMAGDIELNPGPKYPCGICSKNCTWGNGRAGRAINCDTCQVWYHADCLEISTTDYNALGNSDDPWYCPACATCTSDSSDSDPSFNSLSSSLYDSFSSLETDSSTQNPSPIRHIKSKLNDLSLIEINFQGIMQKNCWIRTFSWVPWSRHHCWNWDIPSFWLDFLKEMWTLVGLFQLHNYITGLKIMCAHFLHFSTIKIDNWYKQIYYAH